MTAQPKVCLDNFHPIRILGEGGFGKVILAMKKRSDGCDQHFATKVLKKANIESLGSVTYTMTEKEALVLASGHPFVTTMYSCFQTRVIFNLLSLLHILRVINTEIYHQFENVMCSAFAKLQKWIMSFIMSGCLFICLSVCVEHLIKRPCF